MWQKIILFLFLFTLTNNVYAKIYTVICKSVDGVAEVTDVMAATPFYYHSLTFNIKGIRQEFTHPIKFFNRSLGSLTEQDNNIFGYYIPLSELNQGSQPFKGRIVLAVKENGKIKKEESVGLDAFCSIS